MIGKQIFTLTILVGWMACCYAAPAPVEDGKYVHKTYPYVHVHDNRELGIYHHIHIPYDGGYGPYNGTNIPYIHDEHGAYSQEHAVSTLDINPDSYDIPKPEILLEYGFPDHTPARKKRSIATNTKQQSVLAILPIHYITTAINADDEIAGEYGLEPSKILVDSQTTTRRPTPTTTERPRIRYLDEGKWRIIRQEELKRQHKYDYLYLTENGIYAEEQAKLRDDKNRATGTSGKGYYEYTGDDGKLYQVHYTVGEEGFVPMADHIPTTPPAIQRALDYVAAQERGSALRRF
ncbi:uncharacterized protein LOC119646332 isoform X2 [Hermetia illucens]|uniref:uncharacterized protein LOC119646332 isoform X2 n=1 Tax=Hermetia illucens TaxID=343691 RepID=UPI0018CC19F5|nr:uncharacterized protein LOC119646332 isoform X2 [Hermetia illucens]